MGYSVSFTPLHALRMRRGRERKEANENGRYYQSSSCAVRSAVICYQVANKFEFDPKLLVAGENRIVLSLPYGATDYESAVLPQSVYVQYDALRLEIE